MEAKEYTTIDRAAQQWPSGPWDKEPDKAQWQDEETGLPCLAVRHPSSGHWCGYVGVAEGHPAFKQGYNDVMFGDEYPDVHGGLTFADMCSPGEDESKGVCHTPALGEPDHVWWFGFDCAHSEDYSPRDQHYSDTRGYPFTTGGYSKYRTLDYVKWQCRKLAKQLFSNDQVREPPK